MNLVPIDVEKHKEVVTKFRRDSFVASFGHSEDFSEEEYLIWLEKKLKEFPKSFLLIREENEYIGQLEVTIREFNGGRIGYINLYYLVDTFRSRGYGIKIHEYTTDFFRDQGISEFHLRVSPSNTQAIKFYERIGMEQLYEEHGGKVIRMRGFI